LIDNLEHIFLWLIKVNQLNIKVFLCVIFTVEDEAVTNHFTDSFVCFVDRAGNRPQAKDDAINFAGGKSICGVSVQEVLPQIINKQDLRTFTVDLFSIQINITFILKKLHDGHFKRMLIEVRHYHFPLTASAFLLQKLFHFAGSRTPDTSNPDVPA